MANIWKRWRYLFCCSLPVSPCHLAVTPIMYVFSVASSQKIVARVFAWDTWNIMEQLPIEVSSHSKELSIIYELTSQGHILLGEEYQCWKALEQIVVFPRSGDVADQMLSKEHRKTSGNWPYAQLLIQTMRLKKYAHLHIEVNNEADEREHAKFLYLSYPCCVANCKKRQLHHKILAQSIAFLCKTMWNSRGHIRGRWSIHNSSAKRTKIQRKEKKKERDKNEIIMLKHFIEH